MSRAAPGLLACVLLATALGQEAEVPAEPLAGRFQLVEVSAAEALVLDRRSGVLFAVDMRLRTALMIDPTRGRAVSRPLVVVDAASEPDTPRWPSRAELDARGSPQRFEAIAGAIAGVFDSATGQVFQVLSPQELRVLDPVAGTLTRQAVALVRETPPLDPGQERAVRWLRSVAATERAYLAGHGRYGDGEQLVRADLLPPPTLEGYRLAVWVSPTAPGERWIAAARPLAGGPGFVINHTGVVHRCDEPFQVDLEGCALPDVAIPLE